jgi:hypothetical protein
MANAKIEIIPTGNKYRAQLVQSDGTIENLKGRWNTPQEARRAMLEWKAQVKGADIKMRPLVPDKLPIEMPEGLAEHIENMGGDPPDDESIHAGHDEEDDDDDDEDEDEEYTVESLMDDHTKAQLIDLADDHDIKIDLKSTKLVIATAIIDAWSALAAEEE